MINHNVRELVKAVALELSHLHGVDPVLLESSLDSAIMMLSQSVNQGHKILVCGNGGSASDSSHIVGELMKNFTMDRPLRKGAYDKLLSLYPDTGLATHLNGAIPTISLVDNSALITAIGNDQGYDYIFAQQVYGLGQPGDVLIALSTSGNSINIIRAVQVAKLIGIGVIAFTNGQYLSELADVSFKSLYTDTASIQQYHEAIYHKICQALELQIFGD